MSYKIHFHKLGKTKTPAPATRQAHGALHHFNYDRIIKLIIQLLYYAKRTITVIIILITVIILEIIVILLLFLE